SKDAKKDLSKRGVGSKKVLVTGIPVEKKFFKKQNKNLIRKKLGLEKDKFLILVIGGGFGKGKVEEAVQALNQTDGDFQIVVVTGTNKELFEKLSKQKYDKDIKIYGFVDNVEELMAVSDILVGKAGGCILAESIAARLPIVIHGSFPANEKNNTNYFVRNKVGFIAENEEQLEEITAGLIHDKKKVLDCKRNIESISMDSAAENVVRVILKELN
ncbi:MAG: glycosyltransferase, partial [Nanoarchaeota archaeon]|nr:glycosyltransferase [Nanoarchaeota archaeon]